MWIELTNLPLIVLKTSLTLFKFTNSPKNMNTIWCIMRIRLSWMWGESLPEDNNLFCRKPSTGCDGPSVWPRYLMPFILYKLYISVDLDSGQWPWFDSHCCRVSEWSSCHGQWDLLAAQANVRTDSESWHEVLTTLERRISEFYSALRRRPQ